MRIAIISKALVVGAYQRKLEEIASHPGVSLTAVVPPTWREGPRLQRLERAHTEGYDLRVTPIALNGRFHLHFYPALPRLLRDLQPDLVHIDEEPYNLATYLALRAAHAAGARTLFFTWQNIPRRYPPPFGLMERYCQTHSHGAIAGSATAASVLRAKGYAGALATIPQFGVDADQFRPAGRGSAAVERFTIGYAGRLVEEKGLRVLLAALARLEGDWRLSIAGTGPLRPEIVAAFAARAWAGRLTLHEQVRSDEMPAFYHSLDVLVLPSLTRPNWMEQFGRVLVEAMACGVPVVGSDSGEIPHVIGDAGVTVPEDNAQALAAALDALRAAPARRLALGALGRQRVLAHYTQARVAAETVAFYGRILGQDAGHLPNDGAMV